MARKPRTTAKKDDTEYGLTIPEKPCSTEERETIEKWSLMCSLVVYRGLSLSAAYRSVYDTEADVQCPASIRNSSRFKGMLSRLRAAQGMNDEQVKGCIESLYLSTVTDGEAPLKQRLQAAAQWQKLRGLEKVKELPVVDEDEMIWRQAMSCKHKVLDVQVENG